ncbi:MAG: hypothetical protein LBS16_05600 [Prevotellaceae bacterium]|jgi:hypothetical protein|nr:hypothetical protein [Prevotellaceae bacterium]
MKTNLFLFAALVAAFLSVASFSAAQVTIGGGDPPAAGAVLDLNSATKGGLALSNVNLTDLNTIPVGFPGINSPTDVTPEVKAKLTGAIVYNINSDICLGVYVWDGNCWRKIDKDYHQVKAAKVATLDIPGQDVDAVLRGGAITFEVKNPGDAQFYYWSLNDVLLDTTDTAILATTAIPAGDNQEMKVVLDNCLSLSESKITFNARNVNPASLPAATGGLIHIYSDNIFPYAATSEYIDDGLVAHYDGINNTGDGDDAHSSVASTGWKDLKNAFVLLRGTGTGEWLNNGFKASNNGQSFYNATFPAIYPIGDVARTVEVIFRTPETMFSTNDGTQRIIFFYGGNSTNTSFGVQYRGTTGSCSSGGKFYAIGGNANNLVICPTNNTPSLTTPNTINTVTSTYKNSIGDVTNTKAYINNIEAVIDERQGGNPLNTASGSISIGSNLNGSIFHSLRLYSRVLSRAEIQHNAALDQKRYLATPIVKIGTQQCLNVVVHSSRLITCELPAGGTSGTTVDVEITKTDDTLILFLEDEFTYE